MSYEILEYGRVITTTQDLLNRKVSCTHRYPKPIEGESITSYAERFDGKNNLKSVPVVTFAESLA